MALGTLAVNLTARTAVFEKNQPETLQEILCQGGNGYSPEAREYGFEVWQALQNPYSPDSERGHRELDCYADTWERAVALGLPPPELARFRESSLADAARIAKNRARHKTPEKLWRGIIKKKLNARKAKNGLAADAV